jgi:hypothetical protein
LAGALQLRLFLAVFSDCFFKMRRASDGIVLLAQSPWRRNAAAIPCEIVAF